MTKSPSRPFEVMVATMPGWPDAAPAIAASRSGATGLLNLEETSDSAVVRSALDRLVAFGRGSLGLKVRLGSRLIPELLLDLPAPINTVVLTEAGAGSLRMAVERLRAPGRRILVECTCTDDAALALAAGADGIVGKGHEAGGHVGEETTFVLIQRLLAGTGAPIWAYGGIGLHAAAACAVAGCAGVVLDVQVALARESTVPVRLRAVLERMEGDETICLGAELGDLYRVYRRPGLRSLDSLQRLEASLGDAPSEEALAEWRDAVRSRIGWERLDTQVWPLGQDAAFAAPLARRFHTVGGIVGGLRKAVANHVRLARAQQALAAGAPLARAHGTKYSILQGPMTRVSDTAAFAEAVAAEGALPFLALALLRAPQVRTLLEETRAKLGDRPWGVGILGFVPLELRREQLEVIEEIRPRFAIIAGGRPDQAMRLEALGIATYLHVPAPGLLRVFLDDGARRFIFEGRECGGHVGPRTSFVLWQTMIDALLDAIEGGVQAADLHVVFAGGIHDARSAAMVAAMAAELVEKGVRIGVLLGTAYLFTREAVEGRAIVEGFQREAMACTHTVLLETGPGHSTRCVETPFYQTFLQAKRRLLTDGRSPDEVREELERLNLGRLRIASKGVARAADAPGPGGTRYVEVDQTQQREDGMFMIGQIAALRTGVCTMSELHDSVSRGAVQHLDDAVLPDVTPRSTLRPSRPSSVAIIGMGCLLPKAPNVPTFWANVINKVDAITEVPKDRFDIDLYYDADRKARDKVYSRWGGFLADVKFDPGRYGIPPASLSSIDPLQLLSLEVARQALSDAGYLEREFARDRTSVILGLSGGLGDLGLNYGLRSNLPDLFGQMPVGAAERLPEWTEDSFAGILLNVAAGRVANRFNFGGVNYTVDAACASSLAAVYLGVSELECGTSDMVLVGGVDTVQSPFGFLCFSKAQALSPRGRCRTFDAGADGIAISEGLAMLVLKRLEDAERDGDRVYAVVKGIAGSSDGRGRSLSAPRPEGQTLALERAYAQAGVSPATVGLIEAHGTGTVVGDAAEVKALSGVFQAAGAPPESCAIGSIKSMIGHTKSAAGVTGLMKAALALHHKILPPTLHVEMPNPTLREPNSPFYVVNEPTPWVQSGAGGARRAGVSAFGFGGTNFHVVIEEHASDDFADPMSHKTTELWPAELLVWTAASAAALEGPLSAVEAALDREVPPTLASLAATVCAAASPGDSGFHLAIVAVDADDLRAKLRTARGVIAEGRTSLVDFNGVYLRERSERAAGLAFLFPGQGSQAPHMLAGIAQHFPHIRQSCERAERVLSGRLPQPLGRFIYPPPAFTPKERAFRMDAITDTRIAQPALAAVEVGLLDLLGDLGVHPDMVAGHSYGEYVALEAAGVISERALFDISEARGRSIKESVGETPGTMAAVNAAPDAVTAALGEMDGVWLANFNAPQQTIVSGQPEAVEAAIGLLESRGIGAKKIPVACAFHSPLMEGARHRLAAELARLEISPPRLPVFSNTLGTLYPQEPALIQQLLSDHLVQPVRFADEIRAMYERGARMFVEVGPKTVLTGLVRQILGDRDAMALAVDAPDRHGLVQLLHVLAQLVTAGVEVKLDRLFLGRALPETKVDVRQAAAAAAPAGGWVVNGARARRADQLTDRAPIPMNAAAPADPPRPAPLPVRMGVPLPPGPELGSRGIAPPEESRDGVMLQFQELMSQFLQTQAAVITAYLQGSGVADASSAPLAAAGYAPPRPAIADAPTVEQSPAHDVVAPETVVVSPALPSEQKRSDPSAELLRIVSERTGYPTEMLDLDLNIEADLGIDSIKRVEVLSAFQRQCSSEEQPRVQAAMERLTAQRTLRAMIATLGECLSGGHPPTATEADSSPGARPPREVGADLLRIVSERTGYPTEMLDLDLNIEADLGIDSIKRVEVLSAFQRQCSAEEQPRVQAAMERLTAQRTLRAMIATLGECLSGGHPSTATQADSSPGGRPLRDVRADLLRIVSERTGYPTEMLDLNLNIEADLGIDSIKRVEVLSAFQRQCSAEEQPRVQAAMERLTAQRTLRDMIATLTEALSIAPQTAAPDPPSSGRSAAIAGNGDVLDTVPRFTLTAVATPIAGDVAPEFAGRLWLISDDETGLAEAVAGELREAGERPVLLRQRPVVAALGPDGYGADLTRANQVAELLEAIRREYGAPHALLHLLPLQHTADVAVLTPEEWAEQVRTDIKSLYCLLREIDGDLSRAGRAMGAMLVAATGLGPWVAEDLPAAFPTHGGIGAMLMTAAIEMPDVACRAIHLHVSDARERLTEHLLAELRELNGPVEVAYSRGRRFTVVPKPAGVGPAADKLEFGSDSVFLVTGGARGITAEIARYLAEAFSPQLVLVGLSALPSPESADTADLLDPTHLRSRLTASLRAARPSVTPVEVDAAVRRVLRDREIRRNVTALELSGARVAYHQVDVRDGAAFGELIDRVYQRYGRLDGVVHGAGIIEDKLLRDKTPESFDRVVHTKTDSAFTLVQKLRPESLKFLVFMSSVTAVFGNRGQGDYGAANGVLNALASWCAGRWPGQIRVRALNWGPWDHTGMVSDSVRHQFASRGIQLIPTRAGVAAMAQEICAADGGRAQVVVVGGGPWQHEAPRSESQEITA